MSAYYLHSDGRIKDTPTCSGNGIFCLPQLVAVIPVEDREQVERFARTYLEAAVKRGGPEMKFYDFPETVAQTADALREFANPTTPKPKEPTGWLAAVEDAYQWRWFRHGEWEQ